MTTDTKEKLQKHKKDCRNKKGRNFHKLLPRMKMMRGLMLPLDKCLFLILNLLYVSIDYSHGCDVYDILYTAL